MKDAAAPQGPFSSINAELDRALAMLRGGEGGFLGLFMLLLALLALFSLVMPDTFPRLSTMQAMMFQLPELGLLSLAMAIPLISGGINLAVIATANQAGLLMAWLLTTQMPPDASGGHLYAWVALALLAGLLLCIIIGAATGAVIALTGAHPILVTLGTQTVISGISIWLTRGKTLSGFPEPIIMISNETMFGIPLSFLLFAAVAFGVHIFLTRSPAGMRIHLIGSNLEATRYSGIDTRKVLLSVHVWSSMLCWLAAVVMMGRFNSAGADIAQSYLLITILAAILGGIDPYGGFGRIFGLTLALFILQTIASGFNLLGFNQQLALAFWGATLLFVMAIKRIWPRWRRVRRHQTHPSEARPVKTIG